MINRKFLSVILVVLLGCIALTTAVAQTALSWSAEEQRRFNGLPEVSVGTDATWPPMEYFNREGELVGFDIDLLREIGLRAGFRPVFESVPWDGIFIGLINRRYEMIASSVTILEERKRAMLFSDPYLEAAQYVVVRLEEQSVEVLEDLRGREIGAQIGTTGARIAGDAGAVVRTYDDLGLGIEDLVQGRLDAVVADVAIIEYYVLAHPQYGDRLRILDHPYVVELYGFAIHRDRQDLQSSINEALRSVREEGELQRIKSFWFRHVTPGTPDGTDTP